MTRPDEIITIWLLLILMMTPMRTSIRWSHPSLVDINAEQKRPQRIYVGGCFPDYVFLICWLTPIDHFHGCESEFRWLVCLFVLWSDYSGCYMDGPNPRPYDAGSFFAMAQGAGPWKSTSSTTLSRLITPLNSIKIRKMEIATLFQRIGARTAAMKIFGGGCDDFFKSSSIVKLGTITIVKM